jgi:hypothetical protein
MSDSTNENDRILGLIETAMDRPTLDINMSAGPRALASDGEGFALTVFHDDKTVFLYWDSAADLLDDLSQMTQGVARVLVQREQQEQEASDEA